MNIPLEETNVKYYKDSNIEKSDNRINNLTNEIINYTEDNNENLLNYFHACDSIYEKMPNNPNTLNIGKIEKLLLQKKSNNFVYNRWHKAC